MAKQRFKAKEAVLRSILLQQVKWCEGEGFLTIARQGTARIFGVQKQRSFLVLVRNRDGDIFQLSLKTHSREPVYRFKENAEMAVKRFVEWLHGDSNMAPEKMNLALFFNHGKRADQEMIKMFESNLNDRRAFQGEGFSFNHHWFRTTMRRVRGDFPVDAAKKHEKTTNWRPYLEENTAACLNQLNYFYQTANEPVEIVSRSPDTKYAATQTTGRRHASHRRGMLTLSGDSVV